MAESRLLHIRSPFARAIYNSLVQQNEHRDNPHTCWYSVKCDLLPEAILHKFIQCHQDEKTTAFLDSCFEKSDYVFTNIFHTIVRPILHVFMTQTSANGLLNRGSMFVFSNRQFLTLMGKDIHWKAGSLLDLGAGDGMVTANMEQHFERVYATEVSPPMKSRLAARGYSVLDIDQWSNGSLTYDVISCLNLLDRCDKPVSLLRDIKKSLKPGGRVILALVLPFRPYVETNRNNKPSEFIHVIGDTLEEQLTHLVLTLFEPLGFGLVSFTRLPYLCEGDLNRSFYSLDDAVLVLEPVDQELGTCDATQS